MSRASDELPWWGMLVNAPEKSVRSSVVRLMAKAEHLSYDSDEMQVVNGETWSGVFVYRKESPTFEVADHLRADLGCEVITLALGDVAEVWRWHGHWEPTDDEKPTRVAKSLGVPIPGFSNPSPSRPSRHAAVLEGVTPDVVRPHLEHPDEMIVTSRGVLLLKETSAAYEVAESPRVYMIDHYLDNGDFRCVRIEGQRVAEYELVASKIHTPAETLSDVEGETEPRAIVRRLGIPEDWIFPPSDN